MLVDIGYFRSKRKATKRLGRLVQQKQLRRAGTVCLKGGRPEHVYSRSRWLKADNLLHEIQISRILFKVHADDVRRGPGEVDRALRPDAELRIGGRRFLLEFDNGTKSYPAVVQTRFATYRSCPDLVLWVCSTAARMEGLRKHAEVLRATALFTTLDLALADPHARIWMDFNGDRAALPRKKEGGQKGGPKPGPKGGPKGGTFGPPGCGHATVYPLDTPHVHPSPNTGGPPSGGCCQGSSGENERTLPVLT
jgi:hypothetical protein